MAAPVAMLAAMELKETTYEVSNRIATITLNRPEAMNALTAQMGMELVDSLRKADSDDDVRVVIVTGAGEKAYCAGADISGGESGFVGEGTAERVRLDDYRDGGGQITLALHRMRKPVIAAINGHAVGIGITMTLAMDIRVVADDAKIGFVFARRGIVPEAASSYFLPRIVGIAKAAEFCYTGRVFLAAAEKDSGLFNYVVAHDEVLAKAQELAREIADNTSGVSIALSKAMLWHGLALDDPETAHLIDSKCVLWTSSNVDAVEGVTSFLEKRKPDFKLSPSQDMPEFYPWWNETKV
jgi:enoyl-CoA hydratase/carnithine racemase